MKKKLIASLVLFSSFVARLFADTFTDAIQDLAMRTACIGQYSATQAGGGWYEDPYDYYTPQMIASRLSQESGNMTRTATFYGVCFDYAQFAYNYIKANSDWYRSQGMRENQFWIAGTDDNPNSIDLQYPGDKNNYTVIQNGVYMKRPANNPYRSVKTHRHADGKGKRATNHAWIWIERADGVQFWVDPTWTDNCGYVVYGYVSQSGEEIQCRPDYRYDSPLLTKYPAHLNNLPLPPEMGYKQPPSDTANSTDPEETIKDAGKYYVNLFSGEKIYVSPEAKDGLIWSLGFHTAKAKPLLDIVNAEPSELLDFGLSFSCEAIPIDYDIWHSGIFMWQIDYFAFDNENYDPDSGNTSGLTENSKAAHALLFDINLGYQLGYNYFNFGIYAGGGIGAASEESYIPLMGKNYSFAWEWRAGARLMLNVVSFRAELTYMNKTGYMTGFYAGLLL